LPLETDLSVSPYFDDFDESKKFHKVVFKPGVAVQTRELNQIQTMIQNQIERFGNNIFKRGTIIDGVNFIFHDRYPYVKVRDVQINGGTVVPEDFLDYFVVNESNLRARVINFKDGFESTDPDLKTLYVKYVNSGDSFSETEFSAGQVLTAYDSNNSIHSVTISAAGSGYSNSDVIVFTPVLLVNVASGSVSVGDPIEDPISGAEGVVTATEDQQERIPRNILGGTVAVVSSQVNVVGTSTSFTSDFGNGDFVAIYSNTTAYDLKKINVVTNNTFMNLTSNVSFTNTAATYANTTDSLVYVTYRPTTADLANVSANSSAWSFTEGNTIIGNTASDVFDVISVIGENAAAGITTDSAGRISSVEVTNRGDGYDVVPYVSVKTTSGTGSSLIALNYLGQVTVSSLAGSVGEGYAFAVTEGIIYQKGYFVKVDPQTIVISKYSRTPDDLTVGFSTTEEIINSNIDTSLLDNATGSPNEVAPGADRLKLEANLVVTSVANAAANSEFFNLVEWSEGFPYKQNSRTFYNVINDQMAEAIEDGHGNFVTDRFFVTTTTPTNTALTANTVSIVIDPGEAYIEGYKVKTYSNFVTESSKAIDTLVEENARVSLNYENYVRVNEVGGMFEFDQGAVVDLHDTAKGFLSNNALISTGNTAAVGTKIGEARIRNMMFEQGTPGSPNAIYRLYLFDVNMSSGQNFRSIKSIFQNGTNFDGIADLVLETDATTSANVAVLYGRNNTLLFGSGFEAPLNSNNISYVYRTIDDAQEIANTGIITISLSGNPGKTFPYTGVLSDAQKQEIYLAPAANLVAQANLTGTVNVATTSANVLGNSTTFLTDIKAGQYINIVGGASNNIIRRVVSVTNNTLLTIESNSSFTQNSVDAKRAWPQYVPIQLAFDSDYVANVTSSDEVMNIDLGDTLNTVTNTDIIVAYNVNVEDQTPTAKTPNRNLLVKLRLANNTATTVGPWCLGVPDIFRLRAVYKGTSSVDTASSEVTDEFFIDHNQNSNYYNLGYLYKKARSSSLLTDDDYLLVEFDAFTASPGFYTVTSYVSGSKGTRYTEDSKALEDLTTTVNTLEIPETFDDTGRYYDLINHIDFRPYVSNTANVTANSANVTLNPANTVSFTATDRFFPVPDSIYTHDVEYFLPRVDSVFLDKNGRFRILQGTSGTLVTVPTPAGSMRINNLLMPTYPSMPENISSDVLEVIDTGVYSNKYNTVRLAYKRISTLFTGIDFSKEQPKGYTEYEIGGLERRIADLEYYALLSSVQMGLKDRVIPSSVSPNINRFKYGFFVDDYINEDYSEILSPEYNASILEDFAVPAITSFNVVHTGDLTSSDYTSVKLVSQDLATETANTPGPGNPNYIGYMIIEPPYFKSQKYTVTKTTTAGSSSSGTSGYGGTTSSKTSSPGSTSSWTTAGGKVVCTAMNEAYGFGSFRQAIWLEHSRINLSKAHEVGYHAIFKPLVSYAYGTGRRGWLGGLTRRVLERIARRRTSDIWMSKKNKVDVEGRIYRIILEPLCYAVGSILGLIRR
jgi:hypothetical protein